MNDATKEHGFGELPKPAGMPMVDVNEISQRIVIEKPGVFSLLGRNADVARSAKVGGRIRSHVAGVLSLYANRFRRWMEQSINALRNVFAEFAGIHQAHFAVAPAPDLSDLLVLQTDQRVLREWDSLENASAINRAQIS